ncbi:MAG: hypothetical protein Q7S39_04595 [Ignavibacteria bacterium]|nr:hypothetical protein [Ignavibacteria bacterium]
MEIKYKIKLFLLLVLPLLILNSCLEEPTIAPARRPYSVMRVVNLSNSSSQIFIDNNQPDGSLNNVTIPSTTVYFDINSGKRKFVIKDANQETIFNADIEIISYEREIVVFGGTYSNILENNTFSSMKISEGEIYFNAMPDPGKAHIIVANAFPGYYNGGVEVNPVNLTLFGTHWLDPNSVAVFDTATYIAPGDELLKFGLSFNILNVDPGSYKFDFLNSDQDSMIVSDSSYYAADKRYYLFVYGNPDVLSVYRNEVESLPIRSIYEK